MHLRNFARWLCMVTVVASLAACKVELFSSLTEQEANDMVALLLSHNFDAEKGAATKKGVPVLVESADLAPAIELLRENGYPRDTFNDLGKVFQQQGLISSPLEERVRFIYGLSQSISETLSHIDGVTTARVHVIVPERHPLDDNPGGSSAAVFIKTRPGTNLEDKIPAIKMLVQHSVEGLTYDDVVVALFETARSKRINVDGPPLDEIMGVRYTRDSSDDLMKFGGIIGALILLLLVAVIVLFVMLGRARRANTASDG